MNAEPAPKGMVHLVAPVRFFLPTTHRGLSRGLPNSPLDCWARRCGAVALFESSERTNQNKAPTAGHGIRLYPRYVLPAVMFPGDSPAL